MVSANICKNQSFLSSLDSFSFMEISKLVLFGSMNEMSTGYFSLYLHIGVSVYPKTKKKRCGI